MQIWLTQPNRLEHVGGTRARRNRSHSAAVHKPSGPRSPVRAFKETKAAGGSQTKKDGRRRRCGHPRRDGGPVQPADRRDGSVPGTQREDPAGFPHRPPQDPPSYSGLLWPGRFSLFYGLKGFMIFLGYCFHLLVLLPFLPEIHRGSRRAQGSWSCPATGVCGYRSSKQASKPLFPRYSFFLCFFFFAF